jgi:hypothetical protein
LDMIYKINVSTVRAGGRQLARKHADILRDALTG